MYFYLKPLKNLKDKHQRTVYRSGGNFQSSYYKFLENGDIRDPEITLTYPKLDCDYLLGSEYVPFTFEIRANNRFQGYFEGRAILGDTGTWFSLENYSIVSEVLEANPIDVANNTSITFIFEGMNKFGEYQEITFEVPYTLSEMNCIEYYCESDNSEAYFDHYPTKGGYSLVINKVVSSVPDLETLHSIAKSKGVSFHFYIPDEYTK